MTHRINGEARRLDDVCSCFGDMPDDFEELDGDDFEDDPCPSCGGRVICRPPPVWMEEEEDDC